MVSELPKELQKVIEKHLLDDNFCAAKALHDAWVNDPRSQPSQQPDVAEIFRP